MSWPRAIPARTLFTGSKVSALSGLGAWVLAMVTMPVTSIPATVATSAHSVERRLRSLIHSMRAAWANP